MPIIRLPKNKRLTTCQKIQQAHYDALDAKHSGDVDGNVGGDTITALDNLILINVEGQFIAIHPRGAKYDALAVGGFLFRSFPTLDSIDDEEFSAPSWLPDIEAI